MRVCDFAYACKFVCVYDVADILAIDPTTVVVAAIEDAIGDATAANTVVDAAALVVVVAGADAIAAPGASVAIVVVAPLVARDAAVVVTDVIAPRRDAFLSG